MFDASLIGIALWFLGSAVAHVLTGIPIYAAEMLKVAVKSGGRATNWWIGQYVEFCKTDSRYCTSGGGPAGVPDSCVLAFEGLGFFVVAALCVLVVVLKARESHFYHPVRVAVCCCHCYGTIVYFASAAFNTSGARAPGQLFSHIADDAMNRIVLFWAMNSIWILVPLWLAASSIAFLADQGSRLAAEQKKK